MPIASADAATSLIRVIVADDHATMRQAIVELIDSQPDMTTVGTAGDAHEAAQLASRLRPDVVVLDVNMPEGGGWNAGRAIRDSTPGSRVIAYSGHDEALLLRTMKACGISAFVRKEGDTTLLLAAIRGGDVPEVSAPPPGVFRGKHKPRSSVVSLPDRSETQPGSSG